MGALIPLALTIAPELARWLFGPTAEKTVAAVSLAVHTATGTADAEAATVVLQRDPAAAGRLRVLLAQIAADQEQAARAADLDIFTTALRDGSGARAQTAPLGGQKSALVWSAPIVSGIVLLIFAAVMTLVLTTGVPAGSETMANMLLGTLAAMATSVVSYWVGSSAGSARKDEHLAQTRTAV